MRVLAFIALLGWALPVAGVCECNPCCECEPYCRCMAEPAPQWYEAMYDACTHGEAEEVARLLAAGAEPGEYRSLLRAAGQSGAPDIVELLLPYYKGLPADEVAGYSACIAAGRGDAEALKRLLAAGVNPNATLPCHEMSAPMSLLYLAVCGLHTECVRLLLAQPGIDVNMRGGMHSAPLHMAVSRNSPELVRLLLAAPGIDVNATDSWAMCGSRTPLHTAAALGRAECLRLLLAAPGIKPDARDRRGRTPLEAALEAGHVTCAELLRQVRTW